MTALLNRKNILYFLFILGFTLVALEICGRVYLKLVLKKSINPKFRFSSYRIYEHVPGFAEGNGIENWIEINKQGFRRSTDVSKTKPLNTFRIFLMGGSAAHGISSSAPYPVVNIMMSETIDACLEKELKKLHPEKNIEVINAAVTGYQCFQHTAYLLSELLDYHPDMIIFFDGANDHYFSNSDYNYYLDNKYQFWAPRLKHPTIGGWFNYSMLWLSNASGFARGYIAWKYNKDAAERDSKYPYWTIHLPDEKLIAQHKQTASAQYLRAVETNILILKANNIKCILGLQPMLVLRKNILLSSAEKSFVHEDKNTRVLYPVVAEELKNLAVKYQVDMIDFNPLFNEEKYKSRQLFIDYCHLAPLGSQIVAAGYLPAVDSLITNQN